MQKIKDVVDYIKNLSDSKVWTCCNRADVDNSVEVLLDDQPTSIGNRPIMISRISKSIRRHAVAQDAHILSRAIDSPSYHAYPWSETLPPLLVACDNH